MRVARTPLEKPHRHDYVHSSGKAKRLNNLRMRAWKREGDSVGPSSWIIWLGGQ